MDSKVTWKFIALWIIVCLLIAIAGSSLKAQNYKQKDISQSDFLIYLDTMPSHIPIGSQIPDLEQIGPSRFYPKYNSIKGVEFHHGTPWISERNKSAIIEYLINLIIELMEPGETITIKKVKE